MFVRQIISMRKSIAMGFCAAASTLFAGGAHAGVTTIDLGGGWSASWDDSLNNVLDVNSQGVVGDAVFIQKSAEFTSLASIVVVFTQTSPTAVSNIVIDDEIITNSSGVTWSDFHMTVQASPASFVAFDPVASAGFSVNPYTNSNFTNANTTFNAFGGPGVADGDVWFPGVVSGQLWIHANLTASAPTVFTLTETPVPAPGALALLGLAGLVGSRRRRA
jgi:MYXO-CTERM domain-containing protein